MAITAYNAQKNLLVLKDGVKKMIMHFFEFYQIWYNGQNCTNILGNFNFFDLFLSVLAYLML